ncbi:putative metallocarboxypeptidase ecm14 [Calycina marina]|uniref:Inactive metallocarboxypeptidase ECM14 n=1 Tax=Calycina marina TaxID=1763456 RepID=A0A9P8CHP3_9HELO|nr:putative metallocarboxypeptidase ecm14 [Calycina marina]
MLLPIALLLVSQTLAVPWGKVDQFPTQQHQSHQQRIFPQLTWLRDKAIEKVWGKSANISPEKNLYKRPANSQLPATLLAKYGRDVVLRFNMSTPQEEKSLAEAADTLFLDIWEFRSNWADIRLREDDIPSLLGLLPKSVGKAYSKLIPDLARTIYQSYPPITFSSDLSVPPGHPNSFTPTLKSTRDGVDNMFFQEYQPLSVITPWMRLVASMFTSHVRMINIGTTYEGRDIPALRVGVSPHLGEDAPSRRKTIIISGGTHAREWISVSTVTYIAWSLITAYGKSPGITKLLQEFDFVFIPTLNPDGYVYTWENDRLWRKNRQQTSLRFCRGLDLDRAFGFEWDDSTASNPCSESYPGEQPFEAIEAHKFAEWARNETENNKVHFVGLLDLHSYSQQVLYPYSFSCNADPPTLENLEELGMGLAKAIRISSGQLYGVASACEGATTSKTAKDDTARMETGGMSAIDWFYHELKVKYSYQIKLRDTGSYGFLLPRENIVPTGEEAFNAVKYFGDFLLGNKGIENSMFPELHVSHETVEEVIAPVASAADEDLYEIETGDGNVNWELRRRRRR